MNKGFLASILAICSLQSATGMDKQPATITAAEFVTLCVESDSEIDHLEKLLLVQFDENADITHNGKTALSQAAYYGNLEVCRLLLRYGTQMTPWTEYRITPLMLAINPYENNLAICKLLLEYKAPVNARTKNGMTALIYAIYNEQSQFPNAFEICELLLEHGADLDPQVHKDGWEDCDGRTALIYAIHEAKNERIARLFVDHQKRLEQNMYCLLWCLKNCEHQSARSLYKLSKHLLAPYLKKFTLHMIYQQNLISTMKLNGLIG